MREVKDAVTMRLLVRGKRNEGEAEVQVKRR